MSKIRKLLEEVDKVERVEDKIALMTAALVLIGKEIDELKTPISEENVKKLKEWAEKLRKWREEERKIVEEEIKRWYGELRCPRCGKPAVSIYQKNINGRTYWFAYHGPRNKPCYLGPKLYHYGKHNDLGLSLEGLVNPRRVVDYLITLLDKVLENPGVVKNDPVIISKMKKVLKALNACNCE